MGKEFNKADQISGIIDYLKNNGEVGASGKFVFNNSTKKEERSLIVGDSHEIHSDLLKQAGFDYSKVKDLGDAGWIVFMGEDDIESCEVHLWGDSSSIGINPRTDNGVVRRATTRFLGDLFKDFPNVKVVDDFANKQKRKNNEK